eukprot:g11826.t1 g11826   contig6:657046-658786(+)
MSSSHHQQQRQDSSGSTSSSEACNSVNTNPMEALHQLEVELSKLIMSQRDGGILVSAQMSCPSLFDAEFKISFLRAENYNVKATTDRMMRYWEARADLFGPQKMYLPLTQSGALIDDSLALSRGLIQLLPGRDVLGRAMLFYEISRHDCKLGYSDTSMLRVLWYIIHMAMEDPSARENGFVLLVHPGNCDEEQVDRDLIAKGASLLGNVFPIQWKAIHLCRPCPYYNTYFPLIKLLFPRHMERNVMIHLGTDEEILETMGQHSLPRDRLPSVFGGGEVLDYPGWAFTRKVMEDETAAPSLGSSPQMSSSSALCGEPEKLNPRLSGPASSTGTASRSPQSSGGNFSPSSVGSDNYSKASANSDDLGSTTSSGKAKRPGRKGDVRMHRAVTAKLEQSDMPLVEALQLGGFTFDGVNENGKPHHEVFDQDGVSLMQRKNQLLRRVRVEKKKDEKSDS